LKRQRPDNKTLSTFPFLGNIDDQTCRCHQIPFIGAHRIQEPVILCEPHFQTDQSTTSKRMKGSSDWNWRGNQRRWCNVAADTDWNANKTKIREIRSREEKKSNGGMVRRGDTAQERKRYV